MDILNLDLFQSTSTFISTDTTREKKLEFYKIFVVEKAESKALGLAKKVP